MLSYMVPSPIEDKPPVAPNTITNKNGLQLVLDNNHLTSNGVITNSSSSATVHLNGGTITTNTTSSSLSSCQKKIIKNNVVVGSVNSSNSSLNSNIDIPNVHGATNTASFADKTRTRIANGNTKQTTLKRVSFGSSKGSMVETLIYETPVQEEPEPLQLQSLPYSERTDDTDSYASSEGVKIPSSKVRVSFFESTDRKYVLSTPDNFTNQNCTDNNFVIYEQFVMSSPSQTHNDTMLHCSYDRQESTDSGWDNPFRPDGDLSKEADEIVELIKEGKPITPTTATNPSSKLLTEENGSAVKDTQSSKVNGNATAEKSVVHGVEIQRGTTAKPTDASQIEHVVIKKKPKCNCCVIT